MRRPLLALIVMVMTLVAASGVALAVVRSGGPGNDYLTGTNAEDIMEGKGGNDTVLGFAESDVLYGGDGRLELLAQARLRGSTSISASSGDQSSI